MEKYVEGVSDTLFRRGTRLLIQPWDLSTAGEPPNVTLNYIRTATQILYWNN